MNQDPVNPEFYEEDLQMIQELDEYLFDFSADVLFEAFGPPAEPSCLETVLCSFLHYTSKLKDTLNFCSRSSNGQSKLKYR